MDGGIDDDLADRVDDLLQRATEVTEELAATQDSEDLEAVASYLDDLEDVADEAEDLLEHVDVSELVSAIDWSEVPNAFELEDLPEAIEDGDPTEVVSLRKLLALVDLSEIWSNTNARQAWREKRELDDEVDDLTDDDGDGDGLLDGDDEGLVDGMGDVSMPNPGTVDPESIENAIQSQVSESVGTFREKLLDAHHRFKRIRDENAARFPDRQRNRTRNPTAMSTLPAERTPSGRGMRFSTVPLETRHSTAPNRERIYGTRFDRARGEDDE